jgi:RNA polymerase sigma-70 factor (ECF subfamily)
VLQAVRELVRTLPPNYRDVVMLRVYAGLPFAQVAAALGIRESSAKVLYFRAKEKLTALLRPQLGDAFTEQENDHG